MLKLLHGELSERDIGRELYATHSTVHSHVRAIYRKLAVSSRLRAPTRPRTRPPLASIPGTHRAPAAGAAVQVYLPRCP